MKVGGVRLDVGESAVIQRKVRILVEVRVGLEGEGGAGLGGLGGLGSVTALAEGAEAGDLGGESLGAGDAGSLGEDGLEERDEAECGGVLEAEEADVGDEFCLEFEKGRFTLEIRPPQ